MIDRNRARANRVFCLRTVGLIFLVGLFTPLFAAPEPRSQGSQLVNWHSFFPLDTGYRWVYTVQGPGSSHRWEVKVKGEQSAAPFRSHFQLSGYFGEESRLVRTTLFGTVLERGDNGKDYLWYEFGGRVGKSWVMELAPGDAPRCEDGASLRIGARDEVVTVPAGQFKQVVRIDFMTKCADAGITREWFAPGVGLIRREETSIAGPVISELVYAELGEKVLPSAVYSITLQLSSSRYVNNLMPAVDPSKLPRVSGALIVRDKTDEPGHLVFSSSCIDLKLEIRNQVGEVVLSTTALGPVGCLAVVTRVDLGKEALVVPFSFKLADKDGKPLPDGAYSLTAVLLTHGDEHPAATAMIQVTSVH